MHAHTSRLENKIVALEGHVRDLEAADKALAARMKSSDLVARVGRLEASLAESLKRFDALVNLLEQSTA